MECTFFDIRNIYLYIEWTKKRKVLEFRLSDLYAQLSNRSVNIHMHMSEAGL